VDLGDRHCECLGSEAMPTCPICGTKVSEGAGFCPKCLRRLLTEQAPNGKSKKKLVGIIVACLIAISVVIVITTDLIKVPSGGVAELEYVTLSAYDFAIKLFDPELTNLQRDYLWQEYEGKQAQWTNELKYVSIKEEGLIAHFLNPLDWARTEVEAVFNESQMPSLLQLKEGDLVTYTGVLDRFGGTGIRLTDCTVVSPLSIEPLWWKSGINTHNKRILVGDEVLCLGPSTYDDATEYLPRLPPKITAIERETGELLWEGEKTESVLVGIDSSYAYAWHSVRIVPMSEPDDPWYWYASNITALDKVFGEIAWSSYLSEGVHCSQQDDCLPDEWSESDFVNCCILGGRVKEEITNDDEPGLTFLIDKPPLSELTYEYQGVIYRSACAVYGGVTECSALQAIDQQTDDVLWMMTFREKGMNDFSIVDGILYVSTDEGVGAFQL
jgi:hypothetical protein